MIYPKKKVSVALAISLLFTVSLAHAGGDRGQESFTGKVTRLVECTDVEGEVTNGDLDYARAFSLLVFRRGDWAGLQAKGSINTDNIFYYSRSDITRVVDTGTEVAFCVAEYRARTGEWFFVNSNSQFVDGAGKTRFKGGYLNHRDRSLRYATCSLNADSPAAVYEEAAEIVARNQAALYRSKCTKFLGFESCPADKSPDYGVCAGAVPLAP